MNKLFYLFTFAQNSTFSKASTSAALHAFGLALICLRFLIYLYDSLSRLYRIEGPDLQRVVEKNLSEQPGTLSGDFRDDPWDKVLLGH